MNRLYLYFIVFSLSIWFSEGQNIDEKCIKCLCFGFRQCYNLKHCADMFINEGYWRAAGTPSVGYRYREDRNNQYKRCMENEDCIIRTIQGYIQKAQYKDCNRDRKIDCTDFAAIHVAGPDRCHTYKLPGNVLSRLNKCLMTYRPKSSADISTLRHGGKIEWPSWRPRRITRPAWNYPSTTTPENNNHVIPPFHWGGYNRL